MPDSTRDLGDGFLREYWDHRRAKVDAAVKAGQCRIYKALNGDTFHVAAPYNAKFVEEAKIYKGARWLARERVWSFNPVAHKAVVGLCRRIYGRDKVVGFLPAD